MKRLFNLVIATVGVFILRLALLNKRLPEWRRLEIEGIILDYKIKTGRVN